MNELSFFDKFKVYQKKVSFFVGISLQVEKCIITSGNGK